MTNQRGLSLTAALALAVGLCVVFSGVLGWHGATQRQAGRAEVQARWDQARAQAAVDAQLESARRWTANQETERVANLARARADADARRAADVRLRDIARNYAAQPAADDPTAATERAPVAERCAVLADVLGQVDDLAGELAQAADAARIAGQACERAYDSLTP